MTRYCSDDDYDYEPWLECQTIPWHMLITPQPKPTETHP
jgi:hypothetical protein